MPIGYIQATNTPYQRINVDYFDRKALEQQQRHDLARENYSQFVQGIAAQPFLNEDSRNQYLKEQQQYFDDVINKHAGNLSAGYQDILGAIEKSKLSPYHNVNKRAVEQDKIRQELMTQYGAEAIDMSKLPSKLYNRDKDGKVQWIDPNSIQANVVKADNYEKLFEDISSDLKPRMTEIESDLQRSNNPYYLQAIKTGNKGLLNEVMIDEYVRKYGVNAFTKASSTWAMDNRSVMGYNPDGTNRWTKLDVNGNIVPNTEALATDLKSFIADKMTDNPYLERQFVTNHAALEALKLSNRKKADKAQTDYQQYVKKINEAPLTFDIPIGNQTLNSNSIEDIKGKANDAKLKENTLKTGISDVVKDMYKTLGHNIPDNAKFDYGHVVQLKNSNNTLDKKRIERDLKVKYGVDANADVNKLPENIREKINDDMTRVENSFISIQKLERNRRDEAFKFNEKNDLLTGIDKSLYNKTFEDLNQADYNKKLLSQFNIKSPEDLRKFHDNFKFNYSSYEKDPQKISNAVALEAGLNGKFKELKDKGIESDQIFKVLASESDKAMSNRWSKTLGDKTNELGIEKVIGMFKTSDGENLGTSTMVPKDREFTSPLSWAGTATQSLDDKLKKLKENGYTFKITPFIASPDVNSTGLKQHLKIEVFDDKGKAVPDQNLFIPNVKLSPEYKNLEVEMSLASQTEAMNGYLVNPNYKRENIDRANIQTGQTIAGDDIDDAINDLSNPLVSKKDRNIVFTLPNGQKTAIKIVKDIDGIYSMVGIDGYPVKAADMNTPWKTPSVADIKAAASSLIGEAMYMYNPNVGMEKQRVPRSMFNNNTSYSNYAFSKRDFDVPQDNSEWDNE